VRSSVQTPVPPKKKKKKEQHFLADQEYNENTVFGREPGA
jgi:hypothetical protein